MTAIPGANILNMAMTIIAKQTFTYSAFLGRVLNSIGMQVPSYATPVVVQGSVQPVPRNLYAQLGLDLQGSYFWFFVPQKIFDVARDISGDQFIFNNKTYQTLSKTAWDALDGWDSVLCVQVPSDTL